VLRINSGETPLSNYGLGYVVSVSQLFMNYHLAQVNIAKMLAPLDNPIMADFVSNLETINNLAEASEGFVWRLKGAYDNATSIKVYDDEFLLVNMSVWKDVDSLFRYAYQSQHVEIFKRRKEWFEKMTQMHMALWFVPKGHFPSVEEATRRLDYLRANGETPYAFSFKKRFSKEDVLNFKV
jgi:hypothetical protein